MDRACMTPGRSSQGPAALYGESVGKCRTDGLIRVASQATSATRYQSTDSNTLCMFGPHRRCTSSRLAQVKPSISGVGTPVSG